MARSKESDSDYKDRFFKLLIERLDRQDKTLDEIHDQVLYTNGKVRQLRTDVDDLQVKVSKPIVPWYTDKSLLYIALLCLFAFFSLVAAFMGFRLPTP